MTPNRGRNFYSIPPPTLPDWRKRMITSGFLHDTTWRRDTSIDFWTLLGPGRDVGLHLRSVGETHDPKGYMSQSDIHVLRFGKCILGPDLSFGFLDPVLLGTRRSTLFSLPLSVCLSLPLSWPKNLDKSLRRFSSSGFIVVDLLFKWRLLQGTRTSPYLLTIYKYKYKFTYFLKNFYTIDKIYRSLILPFINLLLST